MRKSFLFAIFTFVSLACYLVYSSFFDKGSEKYVELQQPVEIPDQHPRIEAEPEPDPPSKKVTIEPFIPSDSWTGRRHGYVFKTGDQGLGYYLDSVGTLF